MCRPLSEAALRVGQLIRRATRIFCSGPPWDQVYSVLYGHRAVDTSSDFFVSEVSRAIRCGMPLNFHAEEGREGGESKLLQLPE